MALATEEDVSARLPRDLTDDENTVLAAWLDDASALVVGYVGAEFVEPYPATVTGVVAQMVVRALQQQGTMVPGLEEERTGPFTKRFSSAATGGGPWLAASDKVSLRPYRRGATSVQLYSERYTIS